MAIVSLRINDFRNLKSVYLEPISNGINIVSGENGSGKTSILEAIHYLSVGRSFRTSTSTRLIQHEASHFSLFSNVLNESSRSIPLGMERNRDGDMRMRMGDADVTSLTELAYLLPTRVINSQSHSIFEAGPVHRRKFLDWGLFYYNRQFLLCWRHYERALKQRNVVLRERRTRQEIAIWTEELVKYGLEMHQFRQEYVALLQKHLADYALQLLNAQKVALRYLPGWPEKEPLQLVLQQRYQEEMRYGHTLFGPHRADFDVTVDGNSAKHFLSRGQQKLLICAMILAQGAVLSEVTGKALIYLVDDLPAELDLNSREKLISLLSKQQSQIFISAIEAETIFQSLNSTKTELNKKVFHVEHGSVNEMAEYDGSYND